MHLAIKLGWAHGAFYRCFLLKDETTCDSGMASRGFKMQHVFVYYPYTVHALNKREMTSMDLWRSIVCNNLVQRVTGGHIGHSLDHYDDVVLVDIHVSITVM